MRYATGSRGQVEYSLNHCVARSAWGPGRSGFSTQACHLILIRSSFVGVCSPVLRLHPRPSGSSGATAGHGSASQSPPLAPPSSAGIKSQAGPLPVAPFPVELPSFFSGSLSGDGSSRAWQWDAWALSYCTFHAHNAHTWDHHFISASRWNRKVILISLARLLSFHFSSFLKG